MTAASRTGTPTDAVPPLGFTHRAREAFAVCEKKEPVPRDVVVCFIFGHEVYSLAKIVPLVQTAYAAGFGAGCWFLAASPEGVADAAGKFRGPRARNAQRDEDAFSNCP